MSFVGNVHEQYSLFRMCKSYTFSNFTVCNSQYNGKFLSSTWIHIIDSGGQPEFHDLLPLFTKKASVVVFVLKASESLGDKPTTAERSDSNSRNLQRESYLTNKQILEHCLKAFHESGDVPKIILIGTHKDCPNKLDTEELNMCLQNFSDVVHFGTDQPIALVDCLKQTDEREEQLQAVRNSICETSTEEKMTPLAWFGLEIAMKKKAKDIGYLSLEECRIEADNFPFFRNNSNQFDAALQHFEENGIFLYYPEILQGVFCDPQVLLTMVTKIVRRHYELKTTNDARNGDMRKFVKTAYINFHVLENIMSGQKIVLDLHVFIKLLLHFKVICAIPQDSRQGYIMPALLPHSDNPAPSIKDITDKRLLPPLCILFDKNCAPCGLFCSLVGRLLDDIKWELCMTMKKNELIYGYRNFIALTYDKQTVVTLLDLFSHFSIYVQIPTCTTVPTPTHICHYIKEKVHGCIIDMYKDSKFQDAIQCPAHPQDNHVALWYPTCYQCSIDDCITGPLSEDLEVWKATNSEFINQPMSSKAILYSDW